MPNRQTLRVPTISTNVQRIFSIAVLTAAVLAMAACQGRSRSDAEIARDVQSKVQADQAVQNKQIIVQAGSGVVTLSGAVSSDAERSAAAADAASAAGVRTVVNNLTVASPAPEPSAAAVAPPEPAPPSQAYPPQPTEPEPRMSERNSEIDSEARNPERYARHRHERYPKPDAASRRHAREYEARQRYPRAGSREYPPARSGAPQTSAQPSYAAQQPSYTLPAYEQAAPAQPSYAQAPAQPSYTPPPAAEAPRAQPRPPAMVTVPQGTTLSLRLLDTIDSESSTAGDPFRASLSAPVQVDGNVVIPADADVTGRVVDVQAAGRFKGAALLNLELTRVSFNGHSYAIRTEPWSRQIQGRGKNTAEKVGGGAALGAIIGGIAGGGKGAAIGTVVGGGAGGGAQAVTHAKQITLEPESRLTFRLEQPLTVRPAAVNERNVGRPRLD